jgi:hypothetical protein
MTTNVLYDNEGERRKHLQAVHLLAENGGFSEKEVLCLYEEVLEGFSQRARVKTFLSILVSKKVKELLLER